MKLNQSQKKIIEFVGANPNSEAKAIEKGTKIKAAIVVAEIKKLVEAKILVRHEKGKKLKFSSVTVTPKEEGAETPAQETPAEETKENEAPTGPESKGKEKQKSGRDLTKYKFGGNEYGKGPLVLAVVRKYCEDKPKTTFPQLIKAFPPELLFRFGIVQEVKQAQAMSGERSRFFLKPEQIIKLKDGKNVAVCNQFTSQTIQPFLKAAKSLGYSIR